MDEWMDRLMDNGWWKMDGCIDGQMNKWVDEGKDEWVGGWMD